MEFTSKLRTYFWVKNEARELAEFYTSLLPDSHIEAIHQGPAEIVDFVLCGAPFMAFKPE